MSRLNHIASSRKALRPALGPAASSRFGAIPHLLRSPWLWALSPALVALTTVGLYVLNRAVAGQEPGVYVRPNLSGYILPVLCLALVGGRGLGLFTLGLSGLAAEYFLLPPFGWGIEHSSDWSSLGSLLFTGCIVVTGFDALRQRAAFRSAVTEGRQEKARLRLELKEVEERSRATVATARVHWLEPLLPSLMLPDPPARTPGLSLKIHYDVAVGPGPETPFCDAFSVSPMTTALVVGAVACPGLEGPAGVGIVRHMLRYALCRWVSRESCESPQEVLEGVAAEMNSLLASYSSAAPPFRLAAVLHDAHSQALTAIVCGPLIAFIRRAGSAEVVEAAPIGPLIGCAGGAPFRAQTRVFSAGDVLVLAAGADPPAAQDFSLWKEMLAGCGEIESAREDAGTRGMGPHTAKAQSLAVDILTTEHSRGRLGGGSPCLLVAVATGKDD